MVITVAQMRKLEDEAEISGTSKLELMERAAIGIVNSLEKRFDLKNKKTLFICYHGNNGGDGFAAARIMVKKAYPAKVLFIGEEKKLKDEARINFQRLKELEKKTDKKIFVKEFFSPDIIVDAILGISAHGPLKEPIFSAVKKINSSRSSTHAFIAAADIPTGIDPDTGERKDHSVEADLIITMHDLKPGLEKLKDKTEIVKIFY
jgi:NAD(P)H-hydrate epimerase